MKGGRVSLQQYRLEDSTLESAAHSMLPHPCSLLGDTHPEPMTLQHQLLLTPLWKYSLAPGMSRVLGGSESYTGAFGLWARKSVNLSLLVCACE